MLKLELSNTQIIALELISHNLENNNDFKAAAIELQILSENIESVSMSNYIKIMSSILNTTDPRVGKISLRLLVRDIGASYLSPLNNKELENN